MEAHELVERAMRLGSTVAVKEIDFHEPEVVRTPSGYVDIVFDEGRLLRIRDSRGLDTEIGNWIEEGNQRVLRLPWPTTLANPTTARPGRSRGRQVTERAAAMMQFPKSGTARASVLSTFIGDRREGGDGLIDEDVATRLGMNLYTAAPRRTELVNDGWLRASGKFGRTKMDSESIKWELTPAAVEKLGL
jgi:hypothetical protein